MLSSPPQPTALPSFAEVRALLMSANLREFCDRIFQLLGSVAALAGQYVRIADPGVARLLEFAQATIEERHLLDEHLRYHIVDVLYRVPFRDPALGEALVNLEHQSRIQQAIALRGNQHRATAWKEELLLSEQSVHDSPRMSAFLFFVLYTGEAPWRTEPTLAHSVPAAAGSPIVARYHPTGKLPLLDLRRTAPEKLLRGRKPMGAALRVLQVLEADAEAFAQGLTEALTLLSKLPAKRWLEWRTVMLALLLAVVRRPAVEYPRLDALVLGSLDRSRIAARKQELMAMQGTIAEVWQKEGIARGMVEGRAQGKAEGKAEGEAGMGQTLVADALRFRFGGVSDAASAALQSLSDPSALRAAFELAMQAEDEAAFLERVRVRFNGHAPH
jgi:hypothetical protein